MAGNGQLWGLNPRLQEWSVFARVYIIHSAHCILCSDTCFSVGHEQLQPCYLCIFQGCLLDPASAVLEPSWGVGKRPPEPAGPGLAHITLECG